MAAPPTGTFQTYQANGNREDLIDMITMISPTDTPVLSSTESVRATSVLHEWQTDTLKTPTAVARVEGEGRDQVAAQGEARDLIAVRQPEGIKTLGGFARTRRTAYPVSNRTCNRHSRSVVQVRWSDPTSSGCCH